MSEPWQSWLPESLHDATGAAQAAAYGGQEVECLRDFLAGYGEVACIAG